MILSFIVFNEFKIQFRIGLSLILFPNLTVDWTREHTQYEVGLQKKVAKQVITHPVRLHPSCRTFVGGGPVPPSHQLYHRQVNLQSLSFNRNNDIYR